MTACCTRTGLREWQDRHRPLVRVRRVRPTDGAALLQMYERCGPATRYARWLAPNPVFPKPYLQSLLTGGEQHIAVVALADCRPAGVVGLASAALTPDGCRELGFLVEDRCQAQGIGTLMLDALAGLLGREEGLCASTLFENHRLLDKLARFGTVAAQHDYGVIHARVSRVSRFNEVKGERRWNTNTPFPRSG
jgi:GNAT superfamily N-acetyltransferase